MASSIKLLRSIKAERFMTESQSTITHAGRIDAGARLGLDGFPKN